MSTPPLITEAIKARFAELGPQDFEDEAKILVAAHWFTPDAGWDWWGIAYDEDGGVPQLFCLVSGLEVEFGYVALEELEQARGPWGLPVERDLYWTEVTLDAVRKSIKR